jgi:crossover junction endodeoxyribonuclease RusA
MFNTIVDQQDVFGVLRYSATEQILYAVPAGPEDNARTVALCLPVPPSANRYWRNMRGHMVVSEETKTYKQHVRLLCGSVEPFAGAVAIRFRVFRARRAGDLDNYEKVLIDALKGILYDDDSAVVEIHAIRDDDKHNPRVMLQAWESKAPRGAYN